MGNNPASKATIFAVGANMVLGDSLPQAIACEYQCDINAPISLYDGEGVLTCAGKSYPGRCQIRFTWMPAAGPEVVFYAPIDKLDECALDVAAIGLKARVSGRRVRLGTDEPIFVGFLQGNVTIGPGKGLSRLTFHVANFPFVLGAPIQRGRQSLCGRICLKSTPWRIDIDPVADDHESSVPDLPGRISEARGFSITHVGELARMDGATFDASEAADVLRDVGLTLSLARASFSTPFLRSGFDTTGSKVWQDWSAWMTDAWEARKNWFSKIEPQILQSVFAGWRSLSNIPNANVIGAATHLYINSHAPNLAAESKLVLAQAALEGLTEDWPHPPLPRAPVLPKFTSRAAARIARIAISLGLPLSTPASLPDLAALQKPDANAPALEKMTWVRNSIAHLGNFLRLAPYSSKVTYQALQLAQWHLELALLRLLDVNGLYLNRLSAQEHGDTSKLPWLP